MAETDKGLARVRYVGDARYSCDEQQVVPGRDPLLSRALERSEPAVHDQRAGGRAPPVGHVVQHQPCARPARGGEAPGQYPLPGRQQRDREPGDRVLRPAEQLRRIRSGYQRHQHQRRIGRHRAEGADRRPDVIAPVRHRHQRDRPRPRTPRARQPRRRRFITGRSSHGPFGQLMIQVPGSISGPYGGRPARAARGQAGPQPE
jgi:hypothetical protein